MKLAMWLKEAGYGGTEVIGDKAKLQSNLNGPLEFLGFARVCK